MMEPSFAVPRGRPMKLRPKIFAASSRCETFSILLSYGMF
jgi:hypothetical protein